MKYSGIIYRHYIINDKCIEKSYIGQTTKSLEERSNKGKRYLGNKANHKFARAIKKYGWDNFQHEILLVIECETEEELWFWLDEWECYYIEKYDSYYNGYNSTLGGKSGKGQIPDENARKKMSDSHKGAVFSEEHKKAISKGNKGKKMSEDSKKQISEKRKGMKFSEEHRKNISLGRKGKYTGKNSVSAKKVICLETGQIFDVIQDAAKWCGLKGGALIGQNCMGKRKSAGKHPVTKEELHWNFYEE